ncbi:MAG: CBS domain-containing protein [Thaumarchaeota archaeon]|nr:MAG: CBS domain-containing protein [Nitrososphaerota archaeon]TMQ00676.1 MAG: CBS domain-containing protein [Nitrososphaerota archaeon]
MRVEALIHRSPVTISSSATIKQAAEVFVREGIGLLVIASSLNPVRAEAVLSERDVVRAVAAGMAAGTSLGAISSKKLVRIKRSEPLSRAVWLMMQNHIRHLVVENDDGTLFGVLSIRDFFFESRLLESFMKEESPEIHGGD